MKKHIKYVPFLFLLFFLISFPAQALTCSKKGLLLWFQVLLPSLLPFMIVSSILIKTDLLDYFLELFASIAGKFLPFSTEGIYALFFGMLCGYPMGAKVCADLYGQNRISKAEAQYLLMFTNFPGPAFISSYFCLELLHIPALVLPSFLILYLSAFLCACFFKNKTNNTDVRSHKKSTCSIKSTQSYASSIDDSIMDSFTAIIKLGGYMILFANLQGILYLILHNFTLLSLLLSCFMEITTGISAIAGNPWNVYTSYPLMLAFLSFGGLCVAAQTQSMLSGTDLSIKPYLKGKLFQFFTTLCIAELFVKIFV